MTFLTKQKPELWGGVIEFPDLEPGKYTATAEAWNTDENILEGSGSTKITVKAGETTDCNITMILEGQTAYYSKYMILTDSENKKHIYDYPSCNKSSKSVSFGTFNGSYYNAVEDNNGQIYHIKDDALYLDDTQINLLTDSTNTAIKDTIINNAPLYFDGTTNTLFIATFIYGGGSINSNIGRFYKSTDFSTNNDNELEIGAPFYIGILADPTFSKYNYSIQVEEYKVFATHKNNFYLAYYNPYNNPADSNLNILLTKGPFNDGTNSAGIESNIILSNITPALSGEVTDMAVLEDGTVAVLVRSVGVDSETEGFNNTSVSNEGTVYSRGALVFLSSDLSTYKVYGWTDSHRTISATGKDTQTGSLTKWTSIKAYIPEYEERDTHFYGPLKIVAVRPKELVIADCGANFVLPDYDGKKNGKMFAHNRLMTVDLRNFAISCKKEFSESELKFKNLMVSGGSTDTYTILASSSYNGYVDEK